MARCGTEVDAALRRGGSVRHAARRALMEDA
jgi:hypothetical protein